MRKIQILLAALVAVVMSSCTFKTEATVDVEVTKNNQPQAGVVVWKMHYIGVGGVQYKLPAWHISTSSRRMILHRAVSEHRTRRPSISQSLTPMKTCSVMSPKR